MLAGFCDVSVTLSKWIHDVHPRSDSTELAEAVPIDHEEATLKHIQATSNNTFKITY